jgi:acyl-coenzyme A thioesterase PaaI-like protein
MTKTNPLQLLDTSMTLPGYPRASGMRIVHFFSPAVGEEIIARAEAMQAGSTIGVAKIEVISKNRGVERICAFGTATMRAVDLPTPR